MADVRALLRQQRAARRIEHPHAFYSDAGKLTCTVCNEPVRTESLWDGHLRSTGHRQRLQSLHQASKSSTGNGYAGFVDQAAAQKDGAAPSNKRKLSGSDEEMGNGVSEEVSRRKRTKPGTPSADGTLQHPELTPASRKDDGSKPGKPITPPLTRRTSGTPTLGIEMQIPSRPATPSTGSGSTPLATTPKTAPIGRSPLIPDDAQQQQQHEEEEEEQAPPAPPPPPTATQQPAAATPTPTPVDEDEWAAFEADLVYGGSSTTKKRRAALESGSDAVISAPVMSAAEVAAKSEEEARARRRALADMQLEDDKEEATRALETEFEVMEELEARARRLRERREALRLQSIGGGGPAAPAGGVVANGHDGKGAALGNENAALAEDEGEEDEDEDDWDGFRFRA